MDDLVLGMIIFAGGLIFATLLGGVFVEGYYSNKNRNENITKCIELTGKHLECENAYRSSN